MYILKLWILPFQLFLLLSAFFNFIASDPALEHFNFFS